MAQRRKILHVDMDYFFAQIEIRDNPSLKDKPVIISGPPDSRSVVSTCNYVAREYGVHSGMPAFKAHQLCPDGIFMHSSMSKYTEVSQEINKVFAKYSDLVESGGVDEAYIDVTNNKKGMTSATEVAKQIQQEIYIKHNLTCSIGVGPNKLVAKIASDYNKPAGITVIKPNAVDEFFEDLPIYKIPGIGKKSINKYYRFGIYFGRDFKKLSLQQAQKYFGKQGVNLYYNVRGQASDALIPIRVAKSIGCERTLEHNINGTESVTVEINKLINTLKKRLDKQDKAFKTLTIKVKFSDFHQITRSKTLVFPIVTKIDIHEAVKELLLATPIDRKPIRLLGLSASGLCHQSEALNIVKFKQIYFNLDDL